MSRHGPAAAGVPVPPSRLRRRGATVFVHDSETEDAEARERAVAAAVEGVHRAVVDRAPAGDR